MLDSVISSNYIRSTNLFELVHNGYYYCGVQILNLYIFKSWSVAFIVAALQLSHISIHVIIIFFPNFPIIFFFYVYFFLFK